MKDGVNTWIEQQLHPEGIPDRAVEARIATLPTMTLSNAQIVKTYYEPVLLARKQANARPRTVMSIKRTSGASSCAMFRPNSGRRR